MFFIPAVAVVWLCLRTVHKRVTVAAAAADSDLAFVVLHHQKMPQLFVYVHWDIVTVEVISVGNMRSLPYNNE